MSPFRYLTVAAALLVACSPGPSTDVGVVVDIRGDLTSVESFTVRTEDGNDLVLVPDPDGDFDFPLSHLRSHMTSLDPVRVTFEERPGGVLEATSISDA